MEHVVTQEEHMLVGPSSLKHHLGEKKVNICRFRSGYSMEYVGTSLSKATVVSDSK